MVSRANPPEGTVSDFSGFPPGLWRPPGAGFFSPAAVPLARRLLGCLLVMETPEGPASGVIVETEAYTEGDAASHSRSGPTGRNRPMFGPGGLSYVYLIYGIHHCFNVTSGPAGSGEAVLVRALQPLQGACIMRRRRGDRGERELCSGPGKLCGALGIGREHSGHDLRTPPLRVLAPGRELPLEVSVSTRLGISRDAHLKRRFTVRGSAFLSRPP